MLSEFDIITTCFNQPGLAAERGAIVRLGIGDDCALLAVPPGKELAVSMDSLVEAVHFPAGADPELLGYRALAVNLSDLAAMGAAPLAFTLALTIAAADEHWLQGFARGLKACAVQYGCPLMGGNTARGPLNITLQVHGLVDAGGAITRSGAKPGDSIYVTGALGLSALAIRQLLNTENTKSADMSRWEQAFYKPVPRLAFGTAVAKLVSAGLDISDGLLADLGHICEQSKVGAAVTLADIPGDGLLQEYVSAEQALALAVSGGEDYELLLTANPDQEPALLAQAHQLDLSLHRIGKITTGEGVQCHDAQGNLVTFPNSGWQHFSR